MSCRHTAVPATQAAPHLLVELWRLLRSHRPAFRQERIFHRIRALILGHPFCFARRTITQAFVALGLTDHDWTAYYRLFNEPRIDYEEPTSCFFRETLTHTPEDEPFVEVVDGVQVARHSQKMAGI